MRNMHTNQNWDLIKTDGTRQTLFYNSSICVKKKVIRSDVDAEFIAYSNQNLSNTPLIWNKSIQTGQINTDTIYSTSNSVVEGMTLTKYGSNSGKKSGTVISTNYSQGGQTDYIRISCPQYEGDSGAPLGYNTMVNGTRYYVVVGMVTHAHQVSGGDALACKWSNIENALNVSATTICNP